MRGVVHQLNAKSEHPGERGIPKHAIEEATLSAGGVVGDFNRDRHEEHHDDPAKAILLLPLETIEQLDREGWPVRPGDLGENLTTEGIPYAALAPGTRWTVGAVEIEVSARCDPCTVLYGLPYVGTARGPEFLKTLIGRRGWYARVVRPGRVRVGDPIAPAAADAPGDR